MADQTEEMMTTEIVQSEQSEPIDQETENQETEENIAEDEQPIDAESENKQYDDEKLDDMDYWYYNLPYDPVSFCWKYEGQEDETIAYNIPNLQYLYHVEAIIKPDTLITYIDPMGDETKKPCPDNTKISEYNDVWRLVKWPPPTWDIITDDLNAWNQFCEMDENGDDMVTEKECREYWTNKKLKPKSVEKKVKDLLQCDINKDGKIDFYEFRTNQHVPNEVFFNDDFKIRLSRWSFVIFLPIFGLILINIDAGIPISVLIGISIQFMYMVYFATLGYYFWKGSNVDGEKMMYLYRVFSRPGQAVIPEGNWAPLSMTINQVAWPLKCVHSVSEFSAVDGAIPAIMLSNIGQYTWAMITVHFMIQILLYEDFTWKVADFCELIGVAGLVMLGVFEADPYNKSVNKFHMVGAFCGFGTVIGYIVQQLEDDDVNDEQRGSRTSLAWLLVLLFIVFYILWNMSLSMCFFQECNSWGMYEADNLALVEERNKQFEDENVEDPDDENYDDACSCSFLECCGITGVILVLVCCICTGLPIFLIVIIYAPFMMYKAGKQKKKIKEEGPKHYSRFAMEFQVALPNWDQYITPAIKKRITASSVANVMFEGIVLLVGSTALSLYLMSYERQCDGVCADQVFMLFFLITVSIVAVIGSYGLFFGGGSKFGGGIFDCL